MEDLQAKLKDCSLKCTPQRMEILKAVHEAPDHPSADTVFRLVKERCPSVSLATVYKTLEKLVEVGEIRIALVSSGKTLYDTRLSDHHHFLCRRCGHVEDVDIHLDCMENCLPQVMDHKHQVERSEVVFHGLCKNCLDQNFES